MEQNKSETIKTEIVHFRSESYKEAQKGNTSESILLAKKALELSQALCDICGNSNEGELQLATSYYDLAQSYSLHGDHLNALQNINFVINLRIQRLKKSLDQNSLVNLAISFRGRAKIYKRMGFIELAAFDQKTRKNIEKLLSTDESCLEDAVNEALGSCELADKLDV